MKLYSLPFILFAIYSIAANAAEPISLKGIELNTTKSSFLKLFPKAKCSPANKNSLPKCELKGGTLGELEIDSLSAEFFEERLVNISASMNSTDKAKADHYYKNWKGKLIVKYGFPAKQDEQGQLNEIKLIKSEWITTKGDMLIVSLEDFMNMFGENQNSVAVTLMRSDYIRLSMRHALQWHSKSVKDM